MAEQKRHYYEVLGVGKNASEDDIMAERIIHWAPPITAIVCALIIAVSLVYHFVIA